MNFKVQTINIKKSRDYTVILTNLWNIKFENLNLKILTDEGPKCYFKNLKEKTINIKKFEDKTVILKNLWDINFEDLNLKILTDEGPKCNF